MLVARAQEVGAHGRAAHATPSRISKSTSRHLTRETLERARPTPSEHSRKAVRFAQITKLVLHLDHDVFACLSHMVFASHDHGAKQTTTWGGNALR